MKNMNELRKVIKNIRSNDIIWNNAVIRLCVLVENYGICNMIAAAPSAIEEMEEESILLYGESHHETELHRNREFAIAILDRAMNCCDIDEDNATGFDRRQQVENMIEALQEYKETL